MGNTVWKKTNPEDSSKSPLTVPETPNQTLEIIKNEEEKLEIDLIQDLQIFHPPTLIPKIQIDPKLSIYCGLKIFAHKHCIEKVGPLKFSVQLYGTDNDPYQEDVDDSIIKIGIGGREEIIPTLNFQSGKIFVDLVATKPGDYFVHIKVNNIDLHDTPFRLELEPEDLEPKLTKITGAIQDFIQVGETIIFHIQFYDRYNNPTDKGVIKDGIFVKSSVGNRNLDLDKKVYQHRDGYFILRFETLEENIQDIEIHYFDILLFKKQKVAVLSVENFNIFKTSIQEKRFETKLQALTSNNKPYDAHMVLNQKFWNLYYYFGFLKANQHWAYSRDFKLKYDHQEKSLEVTLMKESKIVRLKCENNGVLIYSIYKVFSRREKIEELILDITEMFQNDINLSEATKLYQKAFKMKRTYDLFTSLWAKFVQNFIKNSIDLNQSISENLMNDYDAILLICKDYFMGDLLFQKIVSEEYSKVFTMKDKDEKMILLKFVELGDKYMKSEQIKDKDIDRYLSFISLCKDKDLFFEYYRVDFIKRLFTILYQENTSFYNERMMISKIKTKFGMNLVLKLEGLIKDKIYSKDLSKEFSTTEFKVDCYSALNFPNYSNENISVPLEISDLPKSFERFYNTKHNSRKLTWIYSLGNIQLLGRWKSGEYQIQLDSIQGFILLLFNSDDVWSILDIELILSTNKIKSALRKLHHRKMINIEEGIVCLNENFQSNHSKINLKDDNLFDQNKTKIQKSINSNRNFEIDACIIRIMKSKKVCSHKELMIETTKQLSSHFQPQPIDIKKRIDDLISREFIERKEGQKDVYVYLP